MKKLIITVLSLLTLTAMLGFKAGDEIELDQYLNARANPNFLKYTKNIKTTLAKGTTGEVLETKLFNSGNHGLKIKVSSGPRAGSSYWVYYNKADPGLHLVDKENIDAKDNVEEAVSAKTNRTISAQADLNEHAVVEATKEAAGVLNKGVGDATTPKTSADCPPEKSMTPPIPPVPTPVSQTASSVCQNCYSPQMAMEDINSGNLKMLGRAIMPGSGQNYSCFFENERAYVVYDNCMGNRKEAPALDFKVISKKGGRVTFYLESFGADAKNSKLERSKYTGTWTIGYSPSAPPGVLDINSVKPYISSFEDSHAGGCYVGASFEAASKDPKTGCYGTAGDFAAEWLPKAQDFWKDQGPTWLPTQAKLRKLVETVPF